MSARVESRFTVPAGGAAASVSSGALTSAVTVTTPAGNYFHTAAGGVSSWATTFQTQLNENVLPFPDNAASIASAIGYGDFSAGAGWLCQEASGNLSSAFLGVTMTAAGTPTYRNAGTTTGKYAVGFDTNTDYFTGGDVYDVTLGDDLVVAWVGKFSSVSGANGWIINKYLGWGVQATSTGAIQIATYDGTARTATTGTTAQLAGEWHAGIAVIDRGAGTMRVGTIGLTSGTSVISATTDISAMITTETTDPFRFGASTVGNDGATTFQMAAAYVATGPSCATTMSANLSTALTNFRSAINSSFTVSLSTATGRVTIENSFWPSSVAFTDTDQRDILGYEYDFDYPQTAAQMATAVGYGTWTNGAGYLCNESSGNLASAFGTPATLTAGGTPTYSNQGARGGIDKAIGFDAGAEYFDGGDSLDVSGTDDLIVLWVGRQSALVSGAADFLASKLNAGATAGWQVFMESAAGTVSFYGADAASATLFLITGVSPQLNHWYVGIAVIDRSTGKCRIGTRSLLDGTESLSAETSVAATTMASSAAFRVGDRADNPAGAPQDAKLSAVYIVTGASVATGLSANLSTALSNFAAYMKSQTGTQQARGLWFPSSPLNCDDHPSMTPEDTDLRTSESPTGFALGLSGNRKYVHRNVRWMNCPVSQIREASATYDNGGLEVFFRDAVSGIGGHPWMGPASAMQIYWSNAGTDTLLGEDANDGAGVTGWKITGVSKFSDIAKMSQSGWTGQWDVTFPRLVGES